MAQYRKYNCRIIDVSLNISPSSDPRKMEHSSLESPHRDESNGNNFIFLRPLDGEISFAAPHILKTAVLTVFSVRSFTSEDRKDHESQDRMTIFNAIPSLIKFHPADSNKPFSVTCDMT